MAAAAYAKALPGLYTFYREDFAAESYNVVGGAANNFIGPLAIGATIGGGGGFWFGGAVPDSVLGYFRTVGGGRSNTAGGDNSTVGGGNRNKASFSEATVGGGLSNTASAQRATVGGGGGNIASGTNSTVGGGNSNTATLESATIGGGKGNTAEGQYATVGGGRDNIASGNYAMVPGGIRNSATGFSSFAAGLLAGANHAGTFVWQDSSGSFTDTLVSTAKNQFLARASGGFKFFTAAGPTKTGAQLMAGSGTWSMLSSQASKTAFHEVDNQDYLKRVAALDIKEWRYKAEDPTVTHVGPMAEDFYAAFGHGPNDHSITTVDADGVALAAIQGLYELVKDLQAENAEMRAVMERAGLE